MLNSLSYTSKDYYAFKKDMLAQLSAKMPEYTDRSATDAGMVFLDLMALGLDRLSFYQDAQANECFLSTAVQKANIVKLCSMLDYTPSYATPAEISLHFVRSTAVSATTTIPSGTIVAISNEDGTIYYTTQADATIAVADNTNDGITSTTVSAIAGYKISDESLAASGTSSSTTGTVGSPDYYDVIGNAYCVTDNTGCLLSTIKVWNYGSSDTIEEWKRVDSFFNSSSNDKHFMVLENSDTSAAVIFGNGVNGINPFTADKNMDVYCNYSIGGGSNSNIATGSELIVSDESSLTDPYSYTAIVTALVQEGYDDEDIEVTRANAPNSWRTKVACITTQDYPDRLVELFPQVLIANAENFENGVLIDHIYVYILFDEIYNSTQRYTLDTSITYHSSYTYTKLGKADSLYPSGTITLKEDISNMFTERKLVGTYVDLFEASSVPLAFNVDYTVASTYNQEDVATAITEAITKYLAIGNIMLGQNLTITDLTWYTKDNIEGLLMIRISLTSETINALGTSWDSEKEQITVSNNQYIKLADSDGITLNLVQ